MPTKRKQSNMHGKDLGKVFVAENVYEEQSNSISCFGAPISLRMMKEMDVMPLTDDVYMVEGEEDEDDEEDEEEYEDEEDECEMSCQPSVKTKSLILKQEDRCQQKETAKSSREDFILFRKQNVHPPGYDPFSKISDEIILHIFQYLPKPSLVKCSSVCKRWRDLSYDETLWRRYDFGRRLVKPYVLETLLSRGITILRLAMSEIKMPVFKQRGFQDPKRFCNLQYLDLSMVTISPNGLADILSLCIYLKKLSVENCFLNENCCRHIARNENLTVLNMAMCSGLTASGLCAISINCKKLTEWNLAWTNMTRNCLVAFLPLMPTSLKRLNLSGNRETLEDEGLIKVTERCPDLIELDISDSTLLTDVSFEALLKNCQKLEHLHTSRAYNIPSDCNRLLKGMKNFKNLEIFRTLTDSALTSLREYMPNIQINKNVFSTIARPTTGIRRTSIWGLRVRD